MQRIRLDELGLNYEVEGAGPHMILLHGHGGNLAIFDSIIDFLTEDYKVYRYDQRGYGLSDKPESPPYSTELWAEDLYKLSIKLGLSDIILGGHSMSGRICALFAKSHPEMVRGLITFNTTWFGSNPIAAGILEETASRIKKESMEIAIETSRSFNSIQDKFEDIREKVRNVLLKNDPVSYANGSKAVAKDFRGGFSENILEQISIPTLIILGDHDSAPLEGAVKMYKGIKDSRLAVIPGSGHYTILEKPELTSIVIKDFLKDLN